MRDHSKKFQSYSWNWCDIGFFLLSAIIMLVWGFYFWSVCVMQARTIRLLRVLKLIRCERKPVEPVCIPDEFIRTPPMKGRLQDTNEP
jgi:hypothetical protein